MFTYKEITLSQSLPIPAQRWLSLLLCAITAAAITVFLSNVSFVQQAYMKWGSILYANPVLHYSFAFLAGIGIKLMLDKFYISHAKRSIGFNWKYPPTTIAVWFSIIATLVYVFISERYQGYLLDDELLFASLKYLHIALFACVLCISFQELQVKTKKVSIKSWGLLFLLLGMFLVMSGYYDMPWPLITTYILLYSIAVILRVRGNGSSEVVSTNNDIALSDSDNEFSDLEDFRAWFKDGSIITSTAQLEQDLQVYANRITERLRNGGDKYEQYMAQHIALCGPFGCGKSSIVAAIANELKKSKKVEAELSNEEKLKVEQQNKINWIHSDISTWGAASGSVAHVILSHIIDDISPHLDMCSFRALPKHYTEALKSGGSFFQFASTLLAGPIDIEQSFQKLNDVLEVTNHKLLITLQDVDRGTGDENEKRLNDIAALLDRLKNRDLSNINFIIAMGNENEVAAEVISKVADYREDIAKKDFTDLLVDYIYENLTRSKVLTVTPYSLESLDDVRNNKISRIGFYLSEIAELNKLISSLRVLKRILRRVNEIWWHNNLKGEVNFISLLMVLALREVKPSLFSNYLNFIDSTKLNSELVDVEKFLEKDTPSDLKEYLKVMLNIKINTVEIKDSDPPKERDIWLLNPNKEYLQTVGCTNDMSYYIQRITRQSISNGECIDQDVIKDILKLTKLPLSEFVEEWLSFDEYKQEKYSQFIFLKFSEDQTLAYQEVGNDNLPDTLSSTECRHVIKFVHYLAKNLTIENIYEIFNRLLYVQDAREHSNALINYLGFNEKDIPIEIETLIYKLNLDKDKGRYLLVCLKQSYKLYHAEKRLEGVSESEKFHCLGKVLSNSEHLKKPVSPCVRIVVASNF
ncbi:P-loop NTPase fold protein [Pseudoalteromonas prydzensis]|uniref:P-loop NTPase fold protein n=1 Tax=Pseudoalteromonas prydzensis TaxID=182141 RepID=UPI003FD53B49